MNTIASSFAQPSTLSPSFCTHGSNKLMFGKLRGSTDTTNGLKPGYTTGLLGFLVNHGVLTKRLEINASGDHRDVPSKTLLLTLDMNTSGSSFGKRPNIRCEQKVSVTVSPRNAHDFAVEIVMHPSAAFEQPLVCSTIIEGGWKPKMGPIVKSLAKVGAATPGYRQAQNDPVARQQAEKTLSQMLLLLGQARTTGAFKPNGPYVPRCLKVFSSATATDCTVFKSSEREQQYHQAMAILRGQTPPTVAASLPRVAVSSTAPVKEWLFELPSLRTPPKVSFRPSSTASRRKVTTGNGNPSVQLPLWFA